MSRTALCYASDVAFLSLVLCVSVGASCDGGSRSSHPVSQSHTSRGASSPRQQQPDVDVAKARAQGEARRCYAGTYDDDVVWLAHSSFGPPAMATPLLGQAWWSWDAEGHAMEAAGGHVLVAVVPDKALPSFRASLRPDPGRGCDARAVGRAEVTAYVREQLAALQQVDAPWAQAERRRLRRLRASIPR